ncbi:MAG: AAA family ATPase [Pseudomonadota bacterium]
MIVVLNGYPGVGKLTIGRHLARRLGGRLVDIHTLYNLAFALTEFGTPAFRETVARVEAIADDLIGRLPPGEPVVFTTVLTGSGDWAQEEWGRFERRGAARGPLCMVHLWCDLEENIRRIEAPERVGKGKLRGAEVARRNHAGAAPLIGADLAHLLRLDVTDLSARDAAERIAAWCRADGAGGRT